MPDPITAEQKLIQQMRRSRYWRWIETYLAARRDALIADMATNATEVAMNKGALQEVARLMRAPEKVVAFLAQAEKQAAETPAADEQIRDFFADEQSTDLVD